MSGWVGEQMGKKQRPPSAYRRWAVREQMGPETFPNPVATGGLRNRSPTFRRRPGRSLDAPETGFRNVATVGALEGVKRIMGSDGWLYIYDRERFHEILSECLGDKFNDDFVNQMEFFSLTLGNVRVKRLSR